MFLFTLHFAEHNQIRYRIIVFLYFNASVNKQLIFSTAMRVVNLKSGKVRIVKLLNNNQRNERIHPMGDLNNCAKKGSSIYALCNINNEKDLEILFQIFHFFSRDLSTLRSTRTIAALYAHCVRVVVSPVLSTLHAFFGGYTWCIPNPLLNSGPLMLIETSSLQRFKKNSWILACMHSQLSKTEPSSSSSADI